MSRTYARLGLTAVLVIGMLTMFAMPAAAQEVPEPPEPDPNEGVTVSGELDAANQAGSLLAEVFGVTILAIDCEFDQDNPTESCSITVVDQDVPPGDGGPGIPSPPGLPGLPTPPELPAP